ncbi:MAG: hypothetical protein HY049_19310 [Acidobacteria bacterium]|nr:hypothetical protein [Acidobacteriota bacterium]
MGVSLLGRPRALARPLAALETAENVAQRARNLDSTKTRRGLPSFRVQAAEAFTYREGNKELHDVKVTLFGPGKERTELSAPLALSTEGESGGWSFENGVELRGDSGFRLGVREMKYRETLQEVSSEADVSFARQGMEGSAKGLRYLVSQRRLELLGDVVVNGDPNAPGIRSIHATRAVIDRETSHDSFVSYVLETAAGENLTGAALDVALDPNSSKVRRVEATGGFRLTSGGGARGAQILGPGRRELTGEALAAGMDEMGDIHDAVATGGVKLAVTDDAGAARSLDASRITLGFAHGALESVTAEENALLVVPPSPRDREQTPTTLKGRAIHAKLNPDDGSLISGDAEGDAQAAQAARTLSAPRITFDGRGNLWVLDATEPGSQARVEGDGGTVTAEHIEIRREEGTLSAKGTVKTLSQPNEGGARSTSGLLSGDGPVHAMSGSLVAIRDGRIARYRDKVRIWQGASSLEAPSIDVADEAGTVEAHGGVVARAPSKSEGGGAPQIATVSAGDLMYSRQAAEARFTGNVHATTAGSRIDADSLVAKIGEGEGITELDATGKVRFQDGARVGDGDHLVVSLKEKRYVLSGRGRLVSIQDPSNQQFVRGVVLTYEGAADRILVESETGGRTWVTLKPRGSEGKKVGPQPPH